MSHLSSTDIRITGKEHEIKSAFHKFNNLQNCIIHEKYGTAWLGNLLISIGITEEEIHNNKDFNVDGYICQFSRIAPTEIYFSVLCKNGFPRNVFTVFFSEYEFEYDFITIGEDSNIFVTSAPDMKNEYYVEIYLLKEDKKENEDFTKILQKMKNNGNELKCGILENTEIIEMFKPFEKLINFKNLEEEEKIIKIKEYLKTNFKNSIIIIEPFRYVEEYWL